MAILRSKASQDSYDWDSHTSMYEQVLTVYIHVFKVRV